MSEYVLPTRHTHIHLKTLARVSALAVVRSEPELILAPGVREYVERGDWLVGSAVPGAVASVVPRVIFEACYQPVESA